MMIDDDNDKWISARIPSGRSVQLNEGDRSKDVNRIVAKEYFGKKVGSFNNLSSSVDASSSFPSFLKHRPSAVEKRIKALQHIYLSLHTISAINTNKYYNSVSLISIKTVWSCFTCSLFALLLFAASLAHIVACGGGKKKEKES